MAEFFTRPAFLIILCAVAYSVATYAMKIVSDTPATIVIVAIALCLGTAVVAEVLLMRQFTIGLAYVAILGAETLIVIGLSYAIGEGFGVKQFAGALLVLGGAMLVST